MIAGPQSPKAIDALVASIPTGLYIGGKWRPSASGATFDVLDPATEERLTGVADATVDDAMAALAAATEAQEPWAARPPRERSEILRRAYEEVVGRGEELAALITLGMGKPLAEARAEVHYGAEFLRWFSEEAVRIEGRWSVAPAGDARLHVIKQAVGPCLLITPWNFPLAMGTRKIGPALAAGCTTIVKPAQQTPLTTLALAAILERAGLPAGVVNVLPSTRAAALSSALVEDARLRKISFTGSTPVGRLLMRQAADNVLRTSMELGGNAPFIVFEDADLDRAVAGAMVAKMRNMGQSCTAANRFYVADAMADEFGCRLAGAMGALTLGHGIEPGVDVGPLIDARQRDVVVDLVEDACDKGATIVAAGRASAPPRGYFVAPTVLADVPADAALLREEIFGPVAPVVRFDDEADAIRMANATEFGLVAFAYTESLRRATRVSEALEVGMVGLNRGLVSNPAAPFGGVKHSGIGREGGREGIEEYLVTKYVAIDA
jgi:succinate-semialdehyde dehydrogenase/glutarate-semialdehyde dehydrogenase